MPPITKEQLLAEVEDLIRTIPSTERLSHHEHDVYAWVGRAAAVVERWDSAKFPLSMQAVHQMQSLSSVTNAIGLTAMRTLLFQARADLRMDVGQTSVVVDQGRVFEYFDELRKVIETAQSEVFFVDQYLDAEFVSRYIPLVGGAVDIKLLGGPGRMSTLLPAVDAFMQQSGRKVQVRSSGDIHERYLFVDQTACYLSGASFKDGAKNAPALLTQIADAFSAMWQTYDGKWQSGKIQRS